MITPWQKLGEKYIQVGFLNVIRKTFRLPDGAVADFETFEGGYTVCVLALTPQQRVVLAKQYRPGVEKTLLELPGGNIDPGEAPLETAKRELLEETGYCGALQYAGSNIDHAYSDLIRHTFVATNCLKMNVPQLDEKEFIEPVELPLDEFKTLLRSGELTDVAGGFMGLDYLEML